MASTHKVYEGRSKTSFGLTSLGSGCVAELQDMVEE